MKGQLSLCAIGVRALLAGAGLITGALAAPAALPCLLPVPKKMVPTPGKIALGPATAIMVSDPSLLPLGAILAGDLGTIHGVPKLAVKVGAPKAGDICLKLAKDNAKYTSLDAYTLAIDQAATVEAGSYQALAFGMMTLVQSVQGDGAGLSLPRLLIEDDADRPFRALQLSIRGGYHSPQFVQQGIDLMRFFKVRVLQLHTTEPLWVGAAFESSNGATNLNDLHANCAWTKNEMDGVIEYARVRGVFLVPHNEMRTNDPFWRATLLVDFNTSDKIAGYVDEADGKGAYQWPAGDNLDGDPRFWNFLKVATQRSYEQFAKGWPDGKLPYYHIGPVYGEGGCNGGQAVKMLTFLKEKNPDIKMMFWNGPGPADPDLSPHKKNIVVDFYSKQWGGDPAGMLAAGWELCNTSWTPLYIQPGTFQKAIAQGKWIADEFAVTRFGKESAFGQPLKANADDCSNYADKVMGSLLSTWDFPGENGAGEGHLEMVLPCIPYYAEHAWNMKPWPYPEGSYEKTKVAFDALLPLVCASCFAAKEMELVGATRPPNSIRIPKKGQVIIKWDAAKNITGDEDVSLEGTLVRADGGAAAATVNGVAFADTLTTQSDDKLAYASAVDRFHCTLPPTRNSEAFGGPGAFSGLSAGYQAILKSAVYAGAPKTATLTLGNLTKGQAYLVQLWLNDSRGPAAATQDRSQILDGTAVMKHNVSQAAGGLGQSIIGRFTATGPTQIIAIHGLETPSGGATGETVCAYQLRAIGTPPPTPTGR